MNQRFTDLILAAIKQRISDLHITGGFPLIFRRDGIIHFDKNVRWSPTEIDALVKDMLSDRQLQMLSKRWSVDYAMSFNQVRVADQYLLYDKGSKPGYKAFARNYSRPQFTQPASISQQD
jgi:Tfp pilus assembly pilus retraction ATPase PilT